MTVTVTVTVPDRLVVFLKVSASLVSAASLKALEVFDVENLKGRSLQ